MARSENCKKDGYELMPEELMLKIFLLLPVVSLLGCKSVCKTWLSIITNPQFIQTHFIESQKRKPCSVIEVAEEQLYIDDHETKTPIQLPKHFDGMPRFVSCCNGLVCIANFDCDVIYLWNPMTRQFKKLPTPRKKSDLYLLMFGFGFDDVSKDYKILRIVFKFGYMPGGRVNYKYACFIEAEMYSANEDSWKEIKVPKKLEKFYFHRSKGVAVFRPDQTRVLYFEGFYKLLSFDLHKEVFRVHSYPKYSQDKSRKSNLLDFEGSVAMIYDESSGDGETVLSLWTLDGDRGNRSWTKQFNLEDHIKNDHVILYLGDGQFVVAQNYDYAGERFFYYHKKKHAKKYLGASPARKLTSVVNFTQSLFSLKGFKQVE